MSYATADDVRQVLNPDQDNLDDDTASGRSTESLEDAVQRATAFIHTYIGKLYTVPVASEHDPDGVLRDWASVIAAWNITLTYSGSNDIADNDPVRLRYNQVLKTIERVQSGNLPMPWPAETTIVQNDVAVFNPYEGQMFGPDDFGIGPSGRPRGWSGYGVYTPWRY